MQTLSWKGKPTIWVALSRLSIVMGHIQSANFSRIPCMGKVVKRPLLNPWWGSELDPLGERGIGGINTSISFGSLLL